MGSMDSGILIVDRVCVNINGKEILRDISVNIMKGQQWAIYGEAGSGKTVFAQTLAGNYAFKGGIHFPTAELSNQEKKVMVVELKHRFRDLQNQSNFYYQQRYNAIDAEATITVEEYLLQLKESEFGNLSKAELLELFGLSRLMKEPLIQLSNGENKRLQILKAMLSCYQILILDEPYTGLDEEGRKLLDNIITILIDSGQHFILLDSRGEVPPCFNRFARLRKGILEQITELENEQINLNPAVPESVREFPSAISFTYPDFDYAVRMRHVDENCTAFNAIASGLFDTIGLFRQLTPLQKN